MPSLSEYDPSASPEPEYRRPATMTIADVKHIKRVTGIDLLAVGDVEAWLDDVDAALIDRVTALAFPEEEFANGGDLVEAVGSLIAELYPQPEVSDA